MPRVTRPEPARCTRTIWRVLHEHRYVGLCDLVLDEHGDCPLHDPR
jgi:hypothetical protein